MYKSPITVCTQLDEVLEEIQKKTGRLCVRLFI